MRGPVDHVDRNAGRPRRGGETFGSCLILEAADRNRGAVKVLDPPCPMPQRERCTRCFRRQRAQLLARLLGKNLDIGAGRRQELSFPRHRSPVAGDHRPLTVEIEKDRQPRECLHARRARLLRAPPNLDRAHQYTSC